MLHRGVTSMDLAMFRRGFASALDAWAPHWKCVCSFILSTVRLGITPLIWWTRTPGTPSVHQPVGIISPSDNVGRVIGGFGVVQSGKRVGPKAVPTAVNPRGTFLQTPTQSASSGRSITVLLSVASGWRDHQASPHPRLPILGLLQALEARERLANVLSAPPVAVSLPIPPPCF